MRPTFGPQRAETPRSSPCISCYAHCNAEACVSGAGATRRTLDPSPLQPVCSGPGQPSPPFTSPPAKRYPRVMALDKGQCPRCSKGLVHGATGPISGLVCKACGGLWLDHDIAVQFREALVSNSRLELSESARIIGESSASRAKRAVDTSPGDLPCVSCGQSMRREKVSRAGFDLDICDQHGTWYDCGELQRIAHLAGAKAPSQIMPGAASGASGGASLGNDDSGGKAAVAFAVLGVIFEILSELG